MRGKKVKTLRRVSKLEQLQPEDQVIKRGIKGGIGKNLATMLCVGELTEPSGTWRQYWTKHLQRISQKNRLPRGFKAPKPLFRID